MATAAVSQFNDYIVKDIALADFGRAEINIAETEMPGLMALREEFGVSKPLTGARITGSLHMTIQTAVLIEDAGRAGRRRALGQPATSSRRRTTPRRAIAARGIPVFAIKGETLQEYWDYVCRIFDWGQDQTCNMNPRRWR